MPPSRFTRLKIAILHGCSQLSFGFWWLAFYIWTKPVLTNNAATLQWTIDFVPTSSKPNQPNLYRHSAMFTWCYENRLLPHKNILNFNSKPSSINSFIFCLEMVMSFQRRQTLRRLSQGKKNPVPLLTISALIIKEKRLTIIQLAKL